MAITLKNFNVYLPADRVETISKSGDNHNGNIIISGYASTGSRDFQGEIVEPSGLDISYLVDNGWIDYEHDTDQVIGVPTKNTYVDDHGLFLEAELFHTMPQVKSIVELYHNIKDNGIDRNLGFSIEGQVLERDEEDDSVIKQVLITGVAVTKNPANPNATWTMLTKSLFEDSAKKALEAGHGISPQTQTDGASFRSERFSDELISMADNLRRAREIGLTPVGQTVAQILQHKDVSDDTLSMFLQLFTGLSYDDSSKIVQQLNTNKLTVHRLQEILSGDASADDDDDDD